MKTFIALGALAALCQSALSQLSEGTYRIGSATLPAHRVLGELEDGQIGEPLRFIPRNGHPGQTWFFTPAGDGSNKRDFLIHNIPGAYINCGTQIGSRCVAGSEEEVFTAELQGDDQYQLVAKNSGFFLRTDGNTLEIAGYDDSPNEVFVLTPTQ